MTMPSPRAVRRISRMRGGFDRVAAHRLELGADQAGAVGPAELLAEETELGGAVAVAGGGVLGVGEAATAALLEAEAELDVLGAGHVRVEVADALQDVAAIGGVGGDRVGGIRGEGEPLPVAEQAGGLALARRWSAGACWRSPPTLPTSGSSKGRTSSVSHWGSTRQSASTKARISPVLSAMPRLRALDTPRLGSRR